MSKLFSNSCSPPNQSANSDAGTNPSPTAPTPASLTPSQEAA
jgi:hypothetical protein